MLVSLELLMNERICEADIRLGRVMSSLANSRFMPSVHLRKHRRLPRMVVALRVFTLDETDKRLAILTWLFIISADVSFID